MRVVLIVPPSITHYVVPPIGLGYLARRLLDEGYEVQIFDALKEKASLYQVLEFLKDWGAEVVGIQFFSCDFPQVKGLSRMIREKLPQIRIILGGAHPSGAPRETLVDFPEANVAFKGEAEIGLARLVDTLTDETQGSLSEIPGLIWRDNGDIRINTQYFEEDLDSLGFPAWELIDPREYPNIPQGVFYMQAPIAPISTSRGCPYPCTFCAGKTLTGKKIRTRSVDHILEEISYLRNKFGVRELHIVDDTFTSDRERVLQFCEGLKKLAPEMVFTFPNGVRLDTLNENLVKVLKDAGCYSMILGVESGSQRILDHMRKGLTLELIREKIELLDSHKIRTAGFFILGYPEETEADIEATIRFARELPLKSAHFSNFLPLPGTEATESLRAEGRLKGLKYEDLFYSRLAFPHKNLNKRTLKQLQRKAYLRFYLRSRVILDMLGQIRSLDHLKSILRRLYDYLFRS